MDIKDLVKGQTDWENVFQLSEAHHVYPLVNHALLDAGIDSISPECMSRLKQRCQKEAVHKPFPGKRTWSFD